jgi:multidrug efflux pump subunit AcrA (membrane-fusion protein)
MADLSDLEVDLSIQERDVSKVFVGQECQVRAEAYPERAYQGRVDRLRPIADRAKGAIPVRVKLKVPTAEQGVFLKPDMGVVVAFLSPTVDGKPTGYDDDSSGTGNEQGRAKDPATEKKTSVEKGSSTEKSVPPSVKAVDEKNVSPTESAKTNDDSRPTRDKSSSEKPTG